MTAADYKIRYRKAAGKQTQEAGFATQDKAITRLTEIYNEKKAAPQSQTKAERLKKYGAMRFEEYTNEGKAGQRNLAEASVRHLDSLLEHHLFPALRSRRMSTFDHKVVDGFIQTMERNGAGLATSENPLQGVREAGATQPPDPPPGRRSRGPAKGEESRPGTPVKYR